MEIITEKIPIAKLKEMTEKMFGNLVKAVVDVERGIMAIDGELHSDEQALLLEEGSEQKNLWGINIYPDKTGEDFVEFDSVIEIPGLKARVLSVRKEPAQFCKKELIFFAKLLDLCFLPPSRLRRDCGAGIYLCRKRQRFLPEKINIRPSQQNRSRGVVNPEIRKIILDTVDKLIEK